MRERTRPTTGDEHLDQLPEPRSKTINIIIGQEEAEERE